MIIAMYLAYFGDHSMLPDDSEYVSMANWTAYPCKSTCTSLPYEYQRVAIDSSFVRPFSNVHFIVFLCSESTAWVSDRISLVSRGHIHITGPNMGDTIDFDVGYLKVSLFVLHPVNT